MERLIVTGGAGFIGSNFVRHLLKQSGTEVIVIDKLTYAGQRANLPLAAYPGRLDLLVADIADRCAMQACVDRFDPTAIVNFAAETHVDRSIDDPGPFVETNIVGTYVLLEVARQAWRQLPDQERSRRRFVHVSTDEVYGSLGDTGLFSETTPYAPNSPYSASKASADHLVRAYYETYALPTIITNCSNNYGPYQFPEKLIPLMILNALEGQDLPIYGDGGNVRDWLHVEDHCEGIRKVLDLGHPGEKYNLGGNNERTNLQIVDLLCRALEQVAPGDQNPALRRRGCKTYSQLKTFVADRPGHDRRYAIDATKVSRELGWRPRYDVEAGIQQTVQWFHDNRDWCAQVQADKAVRERVGLGALDSD